MKFNIVKRLALFQLPALSAATILWIVASLVPLATGVLLRYMFDNLTGNATVAFDSWTLIWLLVLAEVMYAVALVAWYYAHILYEFALEVLVQTNVFRWVIGRLDFSRQPTASGHIISRFRDDSTEVVGIVNEWYRLIGDGVFAIAALIIMLQINALITLVAFVPLTAMMLGIHFASERINRYRKTWRSTAENVTRFVREMFGATQAIKV